MLRKAELCTVCEYAGKPRSMDDLFRVQFLEGEDAIGDRGPGVRDPTGNASLRLFSNRGCDLALERLHIRYNELVYN